MCVSKLSKRALKMYKLVYTLYIIMHTTDCPLSINNIVN